MSDQYWMGVFGTACARGVCDDTMKDGRVDANGVLLSHKIVNDLQHWPIKGGLVKPKMSHWIQHPTQYMLRKVVLALSPLSYSVQRAPITVMYLIKGRGSL